MIEELENVKKEIKRKGEVYKKKKRIIGDTSGDTG